MGGGDIHHTPPARVHPVGREDVAVQGRGVEVGRGHADRRAAPDAARRSQNKVAQVQQSVDEVKGIMVENVECVARGGGRRGGLSDVTGRRDVVGT